MKGDIMRKRLLLIGLLVVGVALLSGCELIDQLIDQIAGVGTTSGVVNFPDPGLEAAIRDAIAKPTGDIHDSDLAGMTSLYAHGRSIFNLEGIQYCTDLTYLNLQSNQIVDISPLSGLANLTELSLADNYRLVDISPLSGLANLTELSLGSCSWIVDISPLSGLSNLTVLDLSYLGDNQIVDISPLSGMTNLTTLFLKGNELVDISPLSGLTNLTLLNLNWNYIVDISPLAGLTNLMSLDLGSNQIVDISPLYRYESSSGLTNLTQLCLNNNQIVDISPLAGLTNLTRLYLFSNPIVDIAPLIGNTGLGSSDYVDIRYNNLCLSPGSPDQLDVDALLSRGVDVSYANQTCL